MEKHILIKKIKKGNILKEYLIYYVIGMTNVEAYVAYDKNDCRLILTELAVKYFEDEDFNPSIKKITLKQI